MQLGYTLLYVKDVSTTVEFYEKAFKIKRSFIHESGTYAEMNTGSTKLGFCNIDHVKNMGFAFTEVSTRVIPPGIEIGFVTENVKGAHAHAVNAGAINVLDPVSKPWGQEVSYVRDCNGFLVEICSPIQ